ncbi:hypothetical protein [Undibacterium flavidum]|uniref:Uncharacterized protein n=1 Tax=Undibacterium flavidum TaxID=2762297 RepID=A0ABR6YFH7_9BURK|nr:hypothetical protein [Undibacterium flavidum]MBC3875291.1 hypothetical protein [Undibacterium flavidum]
MKNQTNRRTRKDLKEAFNEGKMPSQEDFHDLIESMLNMLDEGFDKNAVDGLKIAQLGDGKLTSFYKSIDIGNPMWSLSLDKVSNCLSFRDENNRALLTLSSIPQDLNGGSKLRSVGVGILQPKPEHALDVGGCVASHGRVGRKGEFAVPADGNWYDVTDYLTGCQAWEVVAGVGARDSDGRYALMHAFAMNAFNANGQITYHQTHFGNKCSRIELRWLEADKSRPFDFKLQMRVGCSFGEGVWIKYHMTQLWLDTLMLESEIQPAQIEQPQYSDNGKLKVKIS